jgi:hypothetical protein
MMSFHNQSCSRSLGYQSHQTLVRMALAPYQIFISHSVGAQGINLWRSAIVYLM